MRISDWSSDVCSSDLVLRGELRTSDIQVRVEPWLNRAVAFAPGLKLVTVSKGKSVALTQRGEEVAAAIDANATLLGDERPFLDRKSAVSGKRVSVRVDMGGRRLIQKKKK